MNANPIVPVGFQQAPVMQAFEELVAKKTAECDAIAAERDAAFNALQEIARTDYRDGLAMKELASEVVRQILESRVDARIEARLKAQIEAAGSVA